MNLRYIVICLAAASSLSIGVPLAGATAQNAAPIRWTVKLNKGYTAHYRTRCVFSTHYEVTGADLKTIMKALSQWKVKDVSPTGDATITVTTEKTGVSTMNGAEPMLNAPEEPTPSDINLTSAGVPDFSGVEAEPEGDDAAEQRLGFLLSLLSVVPPPPRAVKTGATWKTEVDDPAVVGKKVTITSTLVARRKALFGIHTLQIKQRADVPRMEGEIVKTARQPQDDRATYTAEGTFDIDASNGLLVSGDFKLIRFPIPPRLFGLLLASPGEYLLVLGTIEMHSERVVAGVNDKEKGEKLP